MATSMNPTYFIILVKLLAIASTQYTKIYFSGYARFALENMIEESFSRDPSKTIHGLKAIPVHAMVAWTETRILVQSRHGTRRNALIDAKSIDLDRTYSYSFAQHRDIVHCENRSDISPNHESTRTCLVVAKRYSLWSRMPSARL